MPLKVSFKSLFAYYKLSITLNNYYYLVDNNNTKGDFCDEVNMHKNKQYRKFRLSTKFN